MAHTPQLPLDLRVTRAALFDNYRAAEGDPVIALIRAHASGYPETGGAHVSDRPAAAETVVFLWGTTGSGKTHLLESAVALAQSRGRNARFLSASAGNTLYTGTDADADLVCLDDVDRIAGDAEAERAVFALFEEQRAAGAQLLVSARRPPSDIAFDLLDLQSRLMWGPVLRIDPLDDRDRVASVFRAGCGARRVAHVEVAAHHHAQRAERQQPGERSPRGNVREHVDTRQEQPDRGKAQADVAFGAGMQDAAQRQQQWRPEYQQQ